jgi:hypothetical protein
MFYPGTAAERKWKFFLVVSVEAYRGISARHRWEKNLNIHTDLDLLVFSFYAALAIQTIGER